MEEKTKELLPEKVKEMVEDQSKDTLEDKATFTLRSFQVSMPLLSTISWTP